MSVEWGDDVDEIIGGDAAAGFAYVTPARGVVTVPMAPLGIRDREAGTVTVNTSLGLPKKLDRLRSNPHVALSYHAREHGLSDRPEHVLVQGVATVDPEPDRAWLESITPEWERFLGKRHGGPLGKLMEVYYWERVAIRIAVTRVLVYDGSGPARVIGAELPADPAPQAPPKNGSGPRTDVEKAVGHVQRLPHALLGWVGGDGLPMLARVSTTGGDERGVRLTTTDGPLPQGGRRAGLTAHRFNEHMVGQEQRVHTGWLDVSGDEAVYAPHTATGYAVPTSRTLMAVGAGIGMRSGKRKARKLGLVAG